MASEQQITQKDKIKEIISELQLSELLLYTAIFPNAEFILEHEFPEYRVLDAYCVNPECKCENVALYFTKKQGDELKHSFSLVFDYLHYDVLASDDIPDQEATEIIKKIPLQSIVDIRKRRDELRNEVHEEMLTKLSHHKNISRRKLGRNDPCHCGSGIKYKKCCLEIDIEKNGKPMMVADPMDEDDDSFWQKGMFSQSVSKEAMERKNRTIHMSHDEEMKFNCKTCDAKISAHNNDWHDGMCDMCFDRTYFKE